MSDQASETQEGGPAIQRYLLIGLGGFAAVVVVGLIIGIIGAVINSDGVANFFRILRDFFIIVLALQGILISVALVVLVLQVSALVNLLRNEIKPIVDETRETMTTIRGTAEFVSKNVTSPVIRASSAVAGARALIGELSTLRRNTTSTRSINRRNGRNGD